MVVITAGERQLIYVIQTSTATLLSGLKTCLVIDSIDGRLDALTYACGIYEC